MVGTRIVCKMDLSIFNQIDNPDLVGHIERIGKVFYVPVEV